MGDGLPTYRELEERCRCAESEAACLREAEEQASHTSRILRLCRIVTRLATSGLDRAHLLNETCRVLVETCGYYNAWFALVGDGGHVGPFFHSGFNGGFGLLSDGLTAGELPSCARRVLASDALHVVLDPPSQCSDCPVASRYADRGGLSMRLQHGDRVFGLLTVSLPRYFAQDPDEQRLFRDICHSIAYALWSAEAQAMREVSERRLSQRETLLEASQRLAHVGGWEWDLSTGAMFWSDETYRIHGLDPGEVEPGSSSHIERSLECYDPSDRPVLMDTFRKCVVEGEPYDLEFPFTDFQRNRKWIRTVAEAVEEDGRIVRVVGNIMDITARKEREEQAQFQAVLLDRIRDVVIATDMDAAITYVNDATCRLFGRPRQDILGDPIADYLVSTVRGASQKEIERCTRRDGVWRGQAVVIDSEGNEVVLDCRTQLLRDSSGNPSGILGVSTDVTDRDRQERVTRSLLSLFDYAGRHTVKELLRKFLDEAEALTRSAIGFYHFVEPDQVTLSLQMWSTNTLKACSAPGTGTHYPIDQAGVWVDCVRDGKPVVHNDYESLPHKKGLPRGHAPVARELVVPVHRDGRIVAILGVGNKEADYTDADIEVVSQLADLAWETVSRRRTEEALRENESTLRRAQRVARVGSWSLDVPSGQLQWSDEIYRIFGVSRDCSVSFELFTECIHPDDRAEVLDAWERATHGEPYDIEHRILADGEVKWVREMAEVEFDPDGEAIEATGIVQDITDRRWAEEEHARLALAVDQAAESIVITDVDGVIQYVNPAFVQLTGYTRDEAIGRTPNILRSGEQDADFYEKMWKTLTRGETWVGRIVNRRKNGDLFTEEAAISPIRDVSGQTVNYVAVKRDITRELDLEARYRQSQKMEAIGQLAGGIAHDFNNIIAGILGYGEMAMEDSEDQPEVHASIAEMVKAGERAQTLVAQILAFSRRQTMRPVELDLNGVIEDAAKMLQRVIGENIRFSFHPSTVSLHIRADRGMIEQVLMNLCVNARDAMPRGGALTLESRCAVLDEEYCEVHPEASPGSYAELVVTDSGCGMTDEVRDRVFEPFFTTKGESSGTGLGLATVYGIVKQHDGFITVYSEPDKGSTFRIMLPLCEEIPESAADAPKAPVAGGTETVLVVEDDEMVRNAALKILERAGYTVLIAQDGMEALTRLDSCPHRIDLAIIDVVMPELGGRETWQRMQAMRPNLNVLFTSGYSDNALHTRFIVDEGFAFLPKPFTRDALLRSVRELLDPSESH